MKITQVLPLIRSQLRSVVQIVVAIATLVAIAYGVVWTLQSEDPMSAIPQLVDELQRLEETLPVETPAPTTPSP
jgi:hypothetical protein